MKNIITSALVLMLFAGVAGTIQAIQATNNGLFENLYQPSHHVLTKKDIYHHIPARKNLTAPINHEKVDKKQLAKTILHPEVDDVKSINTPDAGIEVAEIDNLETIKPSTNNVTLKTPQATKIKNTKKFSSRMFSRGAIDESYIPEVTSPDSVVEVQ